MHGSPSVTGGNMAERTFAPAAQLVEASSLEEIAEILAAGLMRLTAAKSSRMSAAIADKPVDCEGFWSGAVAARDEESRE